MADPKLPTAAELAKVAEALANINRLRRDSATIDRETSSVLDDIVNNYGDQSAAVAKLHRQIEETLKSSIAINKAQESIANSIRLSGSPIDYMIQGYAKALPHINNIVSGLKQITDENVAATNSFFAFSKRLYSDNQRAAEDYIRVQKGFLDTIDKKPRSFNILDSILGSGRGRDAFAEFDEAEKKLRLRATKLDTDLNLRPDTALKESTELKSALNLDIRNEGVIEDISETVKYFNILKAQGVVPAGMAIADFGEMSRKYADGSNEQLLRLTKDYANLTDLPARFAKAEQDKNSKLAAYYSQHAAYIANNTTRIIESLKSQSTNVAALGAAYVALSGVAKDAGLSVASSGAAAGSVISALVNSGNRGVEVYKNKAAEQFMEDYKTQGSGLIESIMGGMDFEGNQKAEDHTRKRLQNAFDSGDLFEVMQALKLVSSSSVVMTQTLKEVENLADEHGLSGPGKQGTAVSVLDQDGFFSDLPADMSSPQANLLKSMMVEEIIKGATRESLVALKDEFIKKDKGNDKDKDKDKERMDNIAKIIGEMRSIKTPVDKIEGYLKQAAESMPELTLAIKGILAVSTAAAVGRGVFATKDSVVGKKLLEILGKQGQTNPTEGGGLGGPGGMGGIGGIGGLGGGRLRRNRMGRRGARTGGLLSRLGAKDCINICPGQTITSRDFADTVDMDGKKRKTMRGTQTRTIRTTTTPRGGRLQRAKAAVGRVVNKVRSPGMIKNTVTSAIKSAGKFAKKVPMKGVGIAGAALSGLGLASDIMGEGLSDPSEIVGRGADIGQYAIPYVGQALFLKDMASFGTRSILGDDNAISANLDKITASTVVTPLISSLMKFGEDLGSSLADSNVQNAKNQMIAPINNTPKSNNAVPVSGNNPVDVPFGSIPAKTKSNVMTLNPDGSRQFDFTLTIPAFDLAVAESLRNVSRS